MWFWSQRPIPLVYLTGARDKFKKSEARESIHLKDYLGNGSPPWDSSKLVNCWVYACKTLSITLCTCNAKVKKPNLLLQEPTSLFLLQLIPDSSTSSLCVEPLELVGVLWHLDLVNTSERVQDLPAVGKLATIRTGTKKIQKTNEQFVVVRTLVQRICQKCRKTS